MFFRKRQGTDKHQAPEEGRQAPGQGEDPQEVSSAKRRKVERLIETGKPKEALDLAKIVHKRLGTAESEALLVDAYLARAEGLSACGLNAESSALLELVRTRFPGAQDRLEAATFRATLRSAPLGDLLRLLARPDISSERRREVELRICKSLTDPGELARSDALPPDHPLKLGALALSRALASATSRQVEDREIALLEISRRSPLAPWKHLVMAMACFHRNDDAACERHLQAIDPESAPARLVSVIRALQAGDAAVTASEAVRRLREGLQGGSRRLEEACERLDKAFNEGDEGKICKRVREAVTACSQDRPELLVRLRQHVSIRANMRDMSAERVREAMGGPSKKDSHFWRLSACSAERLGAIPQACSFWEEYRRHAVSEGLFAPDGPEMAALYLHMARGLRKLGARLLISVQAHMAGSFRGHHEYYHDQPPSVMNAAPAAVKPDLYFVRPERLYERACAIDPDPQVFREWLDWAKQVGSRKAPENAALTWHQEEPASSEPLLYLMESAEGRGAFKKALGYLEKAERVDKLDPKVRKARLRLEMANLKRHLLARRDLLCEKDFSTIESLPEAREGDRRAYLAALKWVHAEMAGEKARAARWQAEAVQQLQSHLAGVLILRAVAALCALESAAWPLLPSKLEAAPDGQNVMAAARACALGRDMGASIELSRAWEADLVREVSSPSCRLDLHQLRCLSEAALALRLWKLAHAASGTGLRRGGPAAARFLLLRSRSLPPGLPDRRERCLAAALELARRQGDRDLAEEALQEQHKEDDLTLSFSAVLRGRAASKPHPVPPESVLSSEREEREYPRTTSAEESPFGAPDDDDEPSDESSILEDIFGLGPEIDVQTLDMILEEMFGDPSPRRRKARRRKRPLW